MEVGINLELVVNRIQHLDCKLKVVVEQMGRNNRNFELLEFTMEEPCTEADHKVIHMGPKQVVNHMVIVVELGTIEPLEAK